MSCSHPVKKLASRESLLRPYFITAFINSETVSRRILVTGLAIIEPFIEVLLRAQPPKFVIAFQHLGQNSWLSRQLSRAKLGITALALAVGAGRKICCWACWSTCFWWVRILLKLGSPWYHFEASKSDLSRTWGRTWHPHILRKYVRREEKSSK